MSHPLRLAVSVAVLATSLSAGCARPQGELFARPAQRIVWPAAPETPRIELIGALVDSRDLHAAQSGREAFLSAVRGSRPPIRFSAPHAVAVSDAGLLAVADAGGACVHIIGLDDRSHATVIGWDDERFAVPVGVTWVGDRLFVTDAERSEVIELDRDGIFQRRFGAGTLTRPVGIAYVAPRQQLCVVDGGAHCVRFFDLSGKLRQTVGQRGTGPGQFNFPSHVCYGHDRLLVADSANFRVQWLDLDGGWIRSFGQKGDGAGDLSLPKGVAVDSEGHIYIADAQFENVQIFDEAGRLLLAFGIEGDAPGEFWLPAGLAMDAEDRLYVADSGNRRIQVFAYLRSSL